MKQFIKHSIESTPLTSKTLLEHGEKKYRMSPNLFRYMAGSPQVLEGYLNSSNTFSKHLSPLENNT